MRAEGASRSRPGGQRLLGVVMMACGALILAIRNNGDSRPLPPPVDASVEVLGRVLDRAGSAGEPVDRSLLEAPAAVPGAVSSQTDPVPSRPLPPPSPTSPTPLAARPNRATAPATITTTTVAAEAVSNQAIDLRVEITPAAPNSGDRVTITVTAIDPDAALQPPLVCVTAGRGGPTMGFDGGDAATSSCAEPERCGDRGTGGGDWPAAYSEGRWSMGMEVLGPNTYTVRVFIASGPSGCSPHPYASEAEITRTVVVAG